ncbi:MAG: hypothetical protein HY788_15670 [Deltaproteobacteria bacterium]|nr:hypothetical protein [Deltaproteobacteria bacterium]
MASHHQLKPELTEEDKALINEVFFEDVVPKLQDLDARTGVLNCEFAGDAYRNWTITFKSRGSGFDIVEFEYDEESRGIALDFDGRE